MSPEFSQFPRKWFLAAAVFALVIASLPALLLLPGKKPVLYHQLSPRSEPALRQTDHSGLPIPWGGTAPENSVRLTVVNVAPGSHDSLDVFLAHDNDSPRRVEANSLPVELSELEPGGYRWSVKLHSQETGQTAFLVPPRGDPAAADFIIPPPSLIITSLQQNRLDGTKLEIHGKTDSGALLQGFADYPGAVLEVEVKPTATTFDGESLIRAPVQNGLAKATFQGRDGSYHWRARLVAVRVKTDWKNLDFGSGPEGDFTIYHALPSSSESRRGSTDTGQPKDFGRTRSDGRARKSNNPEKGSDNHKDSNGGQVSAMSHTFSSALPNASNEPLPSEPKPLPSAWGLAVFRMFVGIGVIVLTLAAAVLALYLKKKFTRHQL